MKTNSKKQMRIRLAAALLAAVFMVCGFVMPTQAAGSVTCKDLCSAALKATGGSGNLKYASQSADDFGALTAADRKRVKSIQYVCDAKEAYSLCVIQASSASDAKALKKALKNYKKRNAKSDYLSDYTKTEQKVFKNAVYGRKGNYVWYIAMSTDKSKNKKGQSAIKNKL